MKPYYKLHNNTDFESDIKEVPLVQRKKCKKTDIYVLIKKSFDKEGYEYISNMYTLNVFSEVLNIAKNSQIYDYTGIDLIIRNGREAQTFEQLKNNNLKTLK